MTGQHEEFRLDVGGELLDLIRSWEEPVPVDKLDTLLDNPFDEDTDRFHTLLVEVILHMEAEGKVEQVTLEGKAYLQKKVPETPPYILELAQKLGAPEVRTSVLPNEITDYAIALEPYKHPEHGELPYPDPFYHRLIFRRFVEGEGVRWLCLLRQWDVYAASPSDPDSPPTWHPTPETAAQSLLKSWKHKIDFDTQMFNTLTGLF